MKEKCAHLWHCTFAFYSSGASKYMLSWCTDSGNYYNTHKEQKVKELARCIYCTSKSKTYTD